MLAQVAAGAGTTRTSRRSARAAGATRARWALKDPEGAELASLVFEFADATTGVLGGERGLGHDPERLIEVELRSHFAGDGEPLAPPSIAVRLAAPDALRGVPAQRALPAARFIGAWRTGNLLTVSPEYGAGEVEAAVIKADIAAPAWLPSLVEALAAIGDHAGTAMPLPGLGQVDPGLLDALLLIADVMRGGRADVRFASATALVPDDAVDRYLASPEPRVLACPPLGGRRRPGTAASRRARRRGRGRPARRGGAARGRAHADRAHRLRRDTRLDRARRERGLKPQTSSPWALRSPACSSTNSDAATLPRLGRGNEGQSSS